LVKEKLVMVYYKQRWTKRSEWDKELLAKFVFSAARRL
jgi:hypothetical protein